jgi:hypothetical protein
VILPLATLLASTVSLSKVECKKLEAVKNRISINRTISELDRKNLIYELTKYSKRQGCNF